MFGGMYHYTNITPYMHLLVNHAPDLIERHGSFSIFSAQGLEKLNHPIDYFKTTNHWHGIQALYQLTRKQNRKMWLARNQIKLHKKHDIQCSQCNGLGHNAKTRKVIPSNAQFGINQQT